VNANEGLGVVEGMVAKLATSRYGKILVAGTRGGVLFGPDAGDDNLAVGLDRDLRSLDARLNFTSGRSSRMVASSSLRRRSGRSRRSWPSR
jgi:hypothetical protein